jgi:hypothetical protein
MINDKENVVLSPLNNPNSKKTNIEDLLFRNINYSSIKATTEPMKVNIKDIIKFKPLEFVSRDVNVYDMNADNFNKANFTEIINDCNKSVNEGQIDRYKELLIYRPDDCGSTADENIDNLILNITRHNNKLTQKINNIRKQTDFLRNKCRHLEEHDETEICVEDVDDEEIDAFYEIFDTLNKELGCFVDDNFVDYDL